MAIGALEHSGYVTNWGWNGGTIYSSTAVDDEAVDLLNLFNHKNPDSKMNKLSFNASFIESPDIDVGIILLKRNGNGLLKPVCNDIIPVLAGSRISDIRISFDGFKIIAPAGTRIRFVMYFY